MSDSRLIAQLRILVDPIFDTLIVNAFACGNHNDVPVIMSRELILATGIYTLLFVQAICMYRSNLEQS